MISIGICDDQAEHIELLARYLGQHPDRSDFRIFRATSPESFLALLADIHFNLVFLDIDMEGMNGIQLGAKIRESHPDTILVYVTAHEEYALKAYQVRAFHYLVKPVTVEALHKVLDEALNAIGNRQAHEPTRTFTVQKKGELISLDEGSIWYFEKVGHKIHVMAADKVIAYYGNFSMLIGQLEPDHFLQCHQGYIVNLDKVRAYRDKTLILEGNRQVPVSRSFADKTRDALAKRLFAGKAAL